MKAITKKVKKDTFKHKLRSRLKSVSLLQVAIVIAVLSLTFSTVVYTYQKTPTTVPTQNEYTIGQTAKLTGRFDITINRVFEDKELEAKMHLPAEQRIIIVHASLKNTSNKPLNYLPSIHTYMRDSVGTGTTIFADVSQPAIPAKEVSPGEIIEGNLAFVVDNLNPQRWIYFDLHFDGSAPIIYTITNFQSS